MSNIDFILISQSEKIRYEDYNNIPLDRVDLYRHLVQLRMVYYDGGFRSHLDLLNKSLYNKYFYDVPYVERRNLLNIWNMPALSGFLAINPLVKKGTKCKIITNLDAEFDIFLESCKKTDPLLVGISSTFILQWAEVGRITRKIREAVSDPIIILGGAFANYQLLIRGGDYFEKPMRKYGIKYILYGYNSENDLLSLIEIIKNCTGSIDSVSNLVYIDSDNNYRTTKTVWNNPEVNSIIPFKEILGKNMYTRTLQIRTASGCPFNCAFCSYPATAKVYKQAEIATVRMQLDEISRISGVEAIVFIDDTINTPMKRFQEIVSLMKEYNFRWYAFYRAQYAEAKIAQEMREGGCDGLFLGLESANDVVLKNMNKRTDVGSYKKGIEVLKKHNIPLFGAFVIGFPGETEDSINDNIMFIEQSGLDFYSIKEFFYLHASGVYARSSDYELRGEGNKWEHSTMNSVQASEMKLKMFENIKNSIHIDPDLGLWYLIYLRDRGFSWDKITDAQKVINKMVSQDNAGNFNDKGYLFKELSERVNNSRYRVGNEHGN